MTNLLDYDMPPWVIDCPRALLEEINIKWQENLPNKRGEPPDIYIENLARFYSILRDLRDKYDLPDAQITMTKIRDYVLDNLVKKGALVKSINYPHPTPDVLLSIDPFELFDTESLIVVAAVSQMQQNNLSNEPAVILETLDEVLEGQDDFYQDYLDSLGQLKCLDLKLPNHKISAIYGLGERFNQINHLADTIDNLVYNQHGNQGTRTYIPVPFFMTDQGFGVWIETDHYLQFQFGQKLEEVESSDIVIKYPESASESQFRVHIFNGSLKEQLAQFNQATGGAKMLPAWALGLWMSSNNWDRDSVVRQEVDQTLALDIPTTVIVFEQWSDERTFYLWNDSRIRGGTSNSTSALQYNNIEFPAWGRWPDPQQLIDDLNQHGLKTILWQIPILRLPADETLVSDPLVNDAKIAKAQNYLVKNSDGSDYIIPQGWFAGCYLLDFTNSAAVEWWFQKRQHLIDLGIAGFKTDGGEMIFGPDLQFYNGMTGQEMRNQYPNYYIRAYHDRVQSSGGITFSRAGYTGLAQMPAHWAGDEYSTWEAFRNSITAGLTAGLSGVVFWGWDIAGFSGEIPGAELFIRATQMATFCPIMQYHAESRGEFNQDRTPWNIAQRTGRPEVIDIFRFYANLRMNLLPYIYSEAHRAVQEFQPLMKAMILEYPNCSEFTNSSDQYLFGDALLVAPVLEEGRIDREVMLPPGKWLDFWTQQVYDNSINTASTTTDTTTNSTTGTNTNATTTTAATATNVNTDTNTNAGTNTADTATTAAAGTNTSDTTIHATATATNTNIISKVRVSAGLDRIPIFVKANSAILFNLGDTGKLGESIGNDVTRYCRPHFLVVVESNFSTSIHDHLGNVIEVTVTGETGARKVNVSGFPEAYEMEVIEV